MPKGQTTPTMAEEGAVKISMPTTATVGVVPVQAEPTAYLHDFGLMAAFGIT